MLFSSAPTKKAVAYYRHSAEDKQENSVPIQREHAQKFAAQYGIEIIHEEADEGKTGLSANRPGFRNLFDHWIYGEDAPPFDYVLVYDVSRWGRFQDQDEAGHYEYLCKQRGKKIIYVVRGFPKEDQPLMGHLQTAIERHMAAEYSRQLSDKVFYGCKKVSEQGFSAGGIAAYGMTRVLLDAQKKPIKKLKKGEWKSISNERVTFAPADDHTTDTVREIFYLLVQKWLTPKDIAYILNEKNIPSASRGQWNREKIVRILTNETYTGTRIYNKTWRRLKQKMRNNPRSEWVISPGAFPAVIKNKMFRDAQEHLYWLMPAQRNRGIYRIRKARIEMRKEIQALLEREGFKKIEDVLQRIPITFSICFYLENIAHWCFIIDETIRQHDFVFAVGISLYDRDLIQNFFLIPTKDFTETNFIIFDGSGGFYGKYKIPEKEVEERILVMATEFTESKTKEA